MQKVEEEYHGPIGNAVMRVGRKLVLGIDSYLVRHSKLGEHRRG